MHHDGSAAIVLISLVSELVVVTFVKVLVETNNEKDYSKSIGIPSGFSFGSM